jgi:phosphoenolpyruvate carboxykinase (ATP)
MLDPTVYAKLLTQKMKEHGSTAWLVNTGWIGGPVGTGKRIDIPSTRAIINAILDGSLLDENYDNLPFFNLSIPKNVHGVDSKLLNPRNLWSNTNDWDESAKSLAQRFIDNFVKFTDNDAAIKLAKVAGPTL